MSQETVVLRKRESALSLSFWASLIFTLGLYVFWWLAKTLTVTDRRVVWRRGLLGSKERSVPLQQVQDVSVEYTLFGRLLGYGTVRVESAGGPATEIVAPRIPRPGQVRDAILERLH